MKGRIPGCPRDPPDSMGQLCERDMKGESQDIPGYPRNPGMSKGSSRHLGERDMMGGSPDVLGILDPPKTERTKLDCLRSLGKL